MVDLLIAIQVATWVIVSFLFFLVSRTSSIFHPFTFYTVFHGIVFVLRPALLQYAGFGFTYSYMRFTPTPETVSITLVVTNLAFCLFAIVSWWAGHRVPRFEPRPEPLSRIKKQALIVTFVALGPLALYSAFINSAPRMFEGSGGIQMVMDPETGIQTLANTTGYLLDAQGMIATLSVILLWVTRFRWYAFLPLALFLAYRAFLGWGRYAMVMSIASLLLVYLFHKRKRWLQPRFIVIAIPLFIVFQQLGEQRDYVRYLVTGEQPYTWEIPAKRTWAESQDTLDFANFEFLTAIVWAVPDRSNTYTYFTQYLQLFTEPIPRMFWPGKPIGAPIKLVTMNEHVNFMGLTNSLVGDGWLSFGWLGVIITISLVAFILGRLHRAFWRHTSSTRAVLAYCTFVPLSLQWFRDGGITIAMFSAWALFPIVFWFFAEKALAFMYGHRPEPALAPALPVGVTTLPEPGARPVLRALERTFPPATPTARPAALLPNPPAPRPTPQVPATVPAAGTVQAEPPESAHVLILKRVTRGFAQGEGRIEVLREASLSIRRGEMVALVGPSGAGKSTLLQIAGLLEPPEAGEVWIDGTDAAALPDSRRSILRRASLGFVYQRHHLLPEFSARENVMLPQMIAGVPRRQARARAEELLKLVGLSERVDHRPAKLSGGEQQRVAIARALANRPSVILADEPTGNLDHKSAQQVTELMREIVRRQRVGALVATHNLALARTMDRALVLRDGLLVEATAADLTAPVLHRHPQSGPEGLGGLRRY